MRTNHRRLNKQNHQKGIGLPNLLIPNPLETINHLLCVCYFAHLYMSVLLVLEEEVVEAKTEPYAGAWNGSCLLILIVLVNSPEFKKRASMVVVVVDDQKAKPMTAS